MRAVFLITLVAFGSFAQGRFDRVNKRTDQGRSKRGFLPQSGAFFEFATASGAGMGTACACTAVTGAKGETLTFTRTGNATCSKQGLATTGIANGDLVVCAGDQPRVESSGGVLGLRVEGARTNSVIRSQEIDNAAWVKQGSSPPVAPTVTANSSTAPDATTTADTLAFPAVSVAATFSIAYATITGTAASWSCSVYVRGASTSGTTYLALTPNSATFNTVACPFTTTGWNRCAVTATLTAAPWFVQVGVDLRDGAQAAQPAQDVLVWGMQCELGAYTTSYIPTVAAGVTRNIESPAFTLSSAVGPSASIAASAQWPSTAVGAVNYLALGNVGDNMTLYRTNDTGAGFQINATITAPAVASMGTTVHRAALADASGTRSAFWDLGSVAAPAASMAAGVTTVWIGRNVGGTPADGIVTRVCVDPDPTRCR
jgi:hypothetical protein